MSCQSDSNRKIKLASRDSASNQLNQTASSVLQVLPQDQRSIAILLFRNETDDPSLDWLKRGLMEMLTTDLKQSPFINVISASRFYEIANKSGIEENTLENLEEIDQIAQNAKIQIILSGKYYYKKEQLLIDVEMRDVNSNKNMYVRSVEGESLEKIFSMVDELSSRVRENLRGDLEGQSDYEINLAEMTNSVEAFRCFTEALENRDKLFIYEAERCFNDAIRYDSTFAAAYLHLAMLSMERKSSGDLEKLIVKADQYKFKLSEPDQFRLEMLKKVQKSDMDGAVTLLEEAVQKFPIDLDFRFQLANYYQFYRRNLELALAEYEYILELDPNRKLVYNTLGYLFAERGDFTTAFSYFDKYQELAPDEPNPYDSKAEILIRAGRFEEAKSLLLTAVEKWPAFKYPNFRLVEIYSELGSYKETFKYLDKLSKVPFGDQLQLESSITRAIIQWRFGKIKEAEKEFRIAMENNPRKLYVSLFAAEMLKSVDDPNSANQIYRETFSRLRREVQSSTFQSDQYDDLLRFLLEADLPPLEVVTFLKDLDIDPASHLSVLRDVGLCLMYFQMNDIAKVQKIMTEQHTKFEKFILENSGPGWKFWKYAYEFMDAISSTKGFEDSYHKLLLASQKSQRNNVEPLVRLGKVRAEALLNKDSKQQSVYKKLGTPPDSTWRVIGSFPIENNSGFTYAFPPENKIDMNVTYELAGRDVSWKKADDGYRDGYTDLKNLFDQSSWSVAYALVYVYSPDERRAQIRLGTDEACKIWLNNRQIWQHYFKKDAVFDRDLVTVLLHPGYNKILLKVTNSDSEWGYYLRVTDEKGNGFQDITFHSYQDVEKTFAAR
jgi:Tfp pilus assembly protein PilF/TolB-like protein